MDKDKLIDANSLDSNEIPAYYGTSIREEDVKAWLDEAQEITLDTLRNSIYKDAVVHGLWEDDASPTNWTEPIRDEVSELSVAALHWEDNPGNNGADFEEELADVIIMCLSVSGKLGIGIDAAVKRKMEANRERPYKHRRTEVENQ